MVIFNSISNLSIGCFNWLAYHTIIQMHLLNTHPHYLLLHKTSYLPTPYTVHFSENYSETAFLEPFSIPQTNYTLILVFIQYYLFTHLIYLLYLRHSYCIIDVLYPLTPTLTSYHPQSPTNPVLYYSILFIYFYIALTFLYVYTLLYNPNYLLLPNYLLVLLYTIAYLCYKQLLQPKLSCTLCRYLVYLYITVPPIKP